VAQIYVVDRSDNEEVIDLVPGETLMQAISGAGMADMLALCGGVCACATCHVYVERDPEGVVPQIEEDEDVLLDGLTHRQSKSRLSCQIRLTDAHNGLKVIIAPEDF